MSQFDVKNYEALQKRKTRTRELYRLPHDLLKNVLYVLNEGGNRTDIFQTCISCTHFESIDVIGGEPQETCKLVGKRPPAKVIADGCEKYSDIFDDIPF